MTRQSRAVLSGRESVLKNRFLGLRLLLLQVRRWNNRWVTASVSIFGKIQIMVFCLNPKQRPLEVNKMATKKDRKDNTGAAWATASASVDDLLLAAMERGGTTLETGRYIMTFKEGAAEEGIASLGARGQGMRVADAREFDDESVSFEAVGDADAVTFPEIGVALVGAGAVQERGLMAAEFESDSPVAVIEPEHFVFSDQYLNMAYTAQATEYAHSGNGGINLISLARIL